MTKETMTGPVNGEVGRGYDKFMRVATLTVNGAATSYSYDNDGLLIGAGDITLTRDPQTGFLTGTALAAITDAYTYSTFGETSNYTAKVGGAVLFNVQYTRDAIGRIATKTETIGGATTVYEYGYDLSGRLVSVKENGVTVSTYDYDANGNRITAVTKAGTFQGFYDLQDRMTKYGDADYTYTANGELLTKVEPSGTTAYNYDVFSNLRSATLPNGTQIDYVIDANNRRIGKKVNGALVQGFVYLNFLNLIAELDGAGNVVSRFVHGHKDGAPAYIIKGGNTYRVIADHLSGPRLVIDTATGAVVQRIDYDEYGNVLSDTNPGFIPFGFGAGMYDQDTKLLRFGARDYDSYAGRWTAKDPAGFNYGEFNVYVYVGSDPVNIVDPSGLNKSWGYQVNDPQECCNKPIRDQIDKECDRVDTLPDVLGDSVHGTTQVKCLKIRCQEGIISCTRNHGGGCEWAGGHAHTGGKKSATICSGHARMGNVGRIAIHEWSHVCGWPGFEDPSGDHNTFYAMAQHLANNPGASGVKSHNDAPWNSKGVPKGEPICPSCTRPDLH